MRFRDCAFGGPMRARTKKAHLETYARWKVILSRFFISIFLIIRSWRTADMIDRPRDLTAAVSFPPPRHLVSAGPNERAPTTWRLDAYVHFRQSTDRRTETREGIFSRAAHSAYRAKLKRSVSADGPFPKFNKGTAEQWIEIAWAYTPGHYDKANYDSFDESRRHFMDAWAGTKAKTNTF